MADEERPAPDFAMRRAVEILAGIYESNQAKRNVPPAPLDRPVSLNNEHVNLTLGETTRKIVEAAWGVAFSYPMRGWHTYAAKEDGAKRFLSLFYKDERLIALEYYLPKADRAPTLAARDYGFFRLSPGDIAIGAAMSGVDERYVNAVGGPAPVVYKESLEARFPGGVAYVMGNEGKVERFALYAT